jgi:hypothetical protein
MTRGPRSSSPSTVDIQPNQSRTLTVHSVDEAAAAYAPASEAWASTNMPVSLYDHKPYAGASFARSYGAKRSSADSTHRPSRILPRQRGRRCSREPVVPLAPPPIDRHNWWQVVVRERSQASKIPPVVPIKAHCGRPYTVDCPGAPGAHRWTAQDPHTSEPRGRLAVAPRGGWTIARILWSLGRQAGPASSLVFTVSPMCR